MAFPRNSMILRHSCRTSLCAAAGSRARHLHSPTAALPQTVASLLHPAEGVETSKTPASSGDVAPVITVNGWIRSVRRMKNVSFAHVGDGSTCLPLQAVLTKEQSEGLTTGTSVRITGEWKQSLKGAEQQRELLAQKVDVLGKADATTYPLQKKYQTPEYLRTLLHLRPRIPVNTSLLHLRSFLLSRLSLYFDSLEFLQVHPPILTSSDCEGAGDVFSISSSSVPPNQHFFKSSKYLTVSTQLHLEAFAAAVPRVWTMSPTFRAEKSDTARHLSEFYMLEAEISFINSLDPLLDFVEDMTKNLVSGLIDSRAGHEVLTAAGDQNEHIKARWRSLLEHTWTRMTYTKAIERLQGAVHNEEVVFVFPPTWGAGLQAEHEKFLAQKYGGSGNGGPVFVTDYPRRLKSFYMLPSSENMEVGKETAACFDLLLPSVGELVGGSLREHRFNELVTAMREFGLAPQAKEGHIDGEGEDGTLGTLQWYADLRKWGSVGHGGFGMGFERLICYLSGVDNVREVSAFPRWAGRCDC